MHLSVCVTAGPLGRLSAKPATVIGLQALSDMASTPAQTGYYHEFGDGLSNKYTWEQQTVGYILHSHVGTNLQGKFIDRWTDRERKRGREIILLKMLYLVSRAADSETTKYKTYVRKCVCVQVCGVCVCISVCSFTLGLQALSSQQT